MSRLSLFWLSSSSGLEHRSSFSLSDPSRTCGKGLKSPADGRESNADATRCYTSTRTSTSHISSFDRLFCRYSMPVEIAIGIGICVIVTAGFLVLTTADYGYLGDDYFLRYKLYALRYYDKVVNSIERVRQHWRRHRERNSSGEQVIVQCQKCGLQHPLKIHLRDWQTTTGSSFPTTSSKTHSTPHRTSVLS